MVDKTVALITPTDLARFHRVAKSMESDATECYFSCREKYGADVAGAILVLYLRMMNGSMNSWPAPDDTEDKVNNILREKGLLCEHQLL